MQLFKIPWWWLLPWVFVFIVGGSDTILWMFLVARLTNRKEWWGKQLIGKNFSKSWCLGPSSVSCIFVLRISGWRLFCISLSCVVSSWAFCSGWILDISHFVSIGFRHDQFLCGCCVAYSICWRIKWVQFSVRTRRVCSRYTTDLFLFILLQDSCNLHTITGRRLSEQNTIRSSAKACRCIRDWSWLFSTSSKIMFHSKDTSLWAAFPKGYCMLGLPTVMTWDKCSVWHCIDRALDAAASRDLDWLGFLAGLQDCHLLI